MYRFRNDPVRRRPLRGARSARTRKGISSRTATLLELCATPGMEAWLRDLPRAEGSALDALRLLHPEWVQRCKARRGPTSAADLAARAFATLKTARVRLLAAGRYLVAGRADREGAYAGYQRPVRRKPAKPALAKPAAAAAATIPATLPLL